MRFNSSNFIRVCYSERCRQLLFLHGKLKPELEIADKNTSIRVISITSKIILPVSKCKLHFGPNCAY